VKTFQIPEFYKSPVISQIKKVRSIQDPRKKDFTPTVLDFGPVRFFIARHFGFCYGVENAIEIAFRALEENEGKRVFLLSQMIHNPEVNANLQSRGVNFLMDTYGKQLISFDELKSEDIVIIPAFGTTLKIQEELTRRKIELRTYDTTCPFVERVWKKAEKLGVDAYTVIIHGKHNHEETRATFSRSDAFAPSIIVKDIEDAKKLGAFITGAIGLPEFTNHFKGRYSEKLKPLTDFDRVGVINQTTMLATETQEIADYFKALMAEKFGAETIKVHFADTRDTLCYATNENQEATYGLLQQKADLAIVVGGYNSSNTSHLVELCEAKLPTYFISSANEIESAAKIYHFNYHKQERISTQNYLPLKEPAQIILTSGASCPDSMVDAVLQKIVGFYPKAKQVEAVLAELMNK
jgi:4-hydroxy-3-methylbut-2-en-1-yl diphosphate reductase